MSEENKGALLPLIGQIAKLKLEPGDVVLLSVPRYVSQAQAECLHRQWKHAFPGGRVIILEAGLSVQVLSGAELKERLEKA